VTCGIAKNEAGYIQLPNKKNDNYFYWYYESRASPSTDPLVVWLNGGPGCSSLLALLSENGPCTVQPNLTTQLNPYSWNSHANVIWLDQPSNVGYSYSTEPDDVDKDEDDVGDNFFWFLNGFLDKHPELEGRDLYITGESYAGHYVPAAAHKIWQQTKIIKDAGTPVRINLKGIAIGNGLTNPEIQMQHQLDMVNNTYNVTLMSPEDYAHAKEMIPKCTAIVKDILVGGDITFTDKLADCEFLLAPFKKAGRNPADIRLPCGDVADATQCYDMTYISEYLNSDAVRKYLNVTSPKPWLECDASVGLNFMKSGDVAINYESYVADLLNDGSVRVLLYVGDADTACNWYGNKAWATALEWTHKAEFNAAEDHEFVTGNGSIKAGVAKAYSNQFTFLRLFNSGHMVPRDQPAVALEMIEKFFRGETF
jgi:carboxypeptidase C (cathepsin A)